MNLDIRKFTSDFHDGSIFKIQCREDRLVIWMESSELFVNKEIILSPYHTLKGKLHIEGIKKIKENGKKSSDLNKLYITNAEIMHFDLSSTKTLLEILLQDLNFVVIGYSTIEIDAEKIWWENIPDMKEPFT